MYMLIVLLLSLLVVQPSQAKGALHTGIGLGLSLDYGTASVQFENGTIVDVAKVEGSPSYKAYMRTPFVLAPFARGSDAALKDTPSFGDELLQSQHDVSFFAAHLPSWLGGSRSPLQPMLRSLKTAVESYLSHTITDVRVVTPFPPSTPFLKNLYYTAKSVSLKTAASRPDYANPAGVLIAYANGLGGNCAAYPSADDPPDDPEQLVLAIDFSRAAMTVLLLDEECSIFETLRVVHDTSLGCDGLSSDAELVRGRIVTALRNITDLPVLEGNGAGINSIGQLVLSGESVDDPRFVAILQETFEGQYEHLITHVLNRADQEKLGRGRDELTYAASRAAASWCLEQVARPPPPDL